jgi:hypothetical protein
LSGYSGLEWGFTSFVAGDIGQNNFEIGCCLAEPGRKLMFNNNTER